LIRRKLKMATKKKSLKKPVKATATANAKAPAQTPAPDPTALSIGDLKNLATILDIASTRGAFKAAEMQSVGFLFNKLQAFLAKVAPPEPKKEATPTTQGAPITPKGVGEI
jgi:hypothetical protein